MTTCTRVGEDESGRAPIDLGMAASKRGSFSVELGLSKKVPPLWQTRCCLRYLRQRSPRLFQNAFSTRVGKRYRTCLDLTRFRAAIFAPPTSQAFERSSPSFDPRTIWKNREKSFYSLSTSRGCNGNSRGSKSGFVSGISALQSGDPLAIGGYDGMNEILFGCSPCHGQGKDTSTKRDPDNV
jgi:hypothetical protein